MQKIDFGKLFGFETVAGCDFLDETFGAKLGAKVGEPAPASPSKTLARGSHHATPRHLAG